MTDFLYNVIIKSTVPPGQPQTLSVQNIGATWVLIHWQPPLEVDIPISYYEVLTCDVGGVHKINTPTPNNSTFINVTRLLPGTAYNFTLVSVIQQAGEVVARSVESVPLGYITTATIVMST